MIVAVIPNLDKRGSSETVEKMAGFFKECGITAYLPDDICCADYEHAPQDELYKIADVIITIGGDGTIIRFAKRAARDGKPVLGINAGRVGYLANIEQNEYNLLSKLKTGEYTIEERMMLNITVKENGNVIGEYEALNDAVISSGYLSRIIDVTASVDGGDVITYHADGLIAATPTGSTAYSMSAGGPVIDPSMKCVCLTPICSHSLAAKPILIGGDKEIKLKAYSKKRTDIYLSVDGRKVTNIKPFTEIYITRSKNAVKLVRINDRSFYKTLSLKFRDARSSK
ncbi:MAG: NAD(+)/NADH kinase [Clostridia bacterium]|nr:NAD(+)/NADH kinase [Clostridia bacterium]